MAGYNERNVLRNCSTRLVDRFAADDVSKIGLELYGKGLVSEESYSKIRVAASPEDKAEQITLAVSRTVKAQPQKFENLVESLREQRMPELAEELQDKLSTLQL